MCENTYATTNQWLSFRLKGEISNYITGN